MHLIYTLLSMGKERLPGKGRPKRLKKWDERWDSIILMEVNGVLYDVLRLTKRNIAQSILGMQS